MPTKNTLLLLRATENNVQDYLANSRAQEIKTYVEQQSKAGQVKVTIAITGPGISRRDILSTIHNWNNIMNGGNCTILGPQPPQGGTYWSGPDWTEIPQPLWNDPDWTEIVVASPSRGWADFQNTDALFYVDDNAQSAVFTAPATIGNKQGRNDFSALLNNVVPDSAVHFFLQNGLLFQQGKGEAVWSDTDMVLVAQPYNIPYKANHHYFVGIAYYSGVWQMCMGDNDVPGTYQCIFEFNAPGTSLKSDRNTDISVENKNTRSNWYSGFSNPWVVSDAAIWVNNVKQSWSSQSRTTLDACATAWPPQNAISGSLVGGNKGYFYLEGIPLYC
jgi:hypothetical protein